MIYARFRFPYNSQDIVGALVELAKKGFDGHLGSCVNNWIIFTFFVLNITIYILLYLSGKIVKH